MMREDWVQVNIESVFKKLDNGKEINQGWSPQCKNYPSSSEDIWGVLKTTAIQKNEFWDHENKELPKDKEARAHLEVKAGDIILTCAGPRNRCGVACTVIKTRPKLLLSGKMYRFRPDERVMTTEFLTFFLQTQESWSEIDKMKTGTSDSGLNLTQGRFRKLPIKIAPLPEQRSIVTKIEELFSDLDKGVADLKKAQNQLKIYRQAVLKKAFKELVNKGWEESLLGDISSKITKGSTPTTYGFKYQNEGINFIKIENVIDGKIDKKSIYQFISEEAHENQKRSQLLDGDVLFSIAGTIGETCLITKDLLPANTNQAFAIISGFNQVLDANFLRKQLDSFMSRKLKDKARGGAMNNVSLTDLKNLKVVIPEMEIQHQVVKEIESRLSVCDKVEKSISESLEKAEVLRQSILKKAFEGNLLSAQEIEKCKTAPDYEPAAVLLEKIKNL